MDYLGLDKTKVEHTAAKLNELLASYHIHYQKLRNFHWNLKSNKFFTLHEKFEELYNDANEKIDEIAERLLTLNVTPLSQLSDYLELSVIKEAPVSLSDNEMVKAIVEDLTALIKLKREVIKRAAEAEDEGTIDMMGSFIGSLEKHCWMLTSWLQQHEAHTVPVEGRTQPRELRRPSLKSSEKNRAVL